MRILLMTVALMGGLFSWFHNRDNLDLTSSIHHETTVLTSDNSQKTHEQASSSRPLLVETAAADSGSPLQPLIDAELPQLKSHMITFWQDCKKYQNCQLQLDELAQIATLQRYNLIAQYPQKMQQLQQLFGTSFIKQDSDLKTKIALVQKHREAIWGDNAAALFAEENQHYAQQLALADIYQNSQFYSDDENLAALERWQAQQSQDYSAEQQYQQASQLLTAGKSPEQAQQINTALAKKYLSNRESQAVISRLQATANQAQQAQDYQAGLAALKQQLAHARQTNLAALEETQWQQYQSDQITDYRLAFFSNNQ